MKEALTFNDVNIVPGFSDIASRSEVDLSCLGITLPVIAANMDTVTDWCMSRAMLDYGAQACLHRFGTIEETVEMFLNSCSTKLSGKSKPMVSIGLGSIELDRAKALFDYGAETFIIDVAHGSQLAVLKQAIRLREIIQANGSIVVGNFASAKSVKEFKDRNIINGIKVGIGPGAACTTRIKTGVGVPQFTAIQEISNELKGTGIIIIGDGGLKTPGDIAKALGAGASMVMIGSMLAGTDESPGEIVYMHKGMPLPEEKFKKYRGSASKESYEAQGKVGKHRTAEGESFLVPYKGPVADILQDIEGGLRSAFTYVGARNLKEFHDKVEFVRVTHSGYIEGTAHKGK